jgi:hypothetical protein
MHWIVTNIKWLMLVSGALTCTMLYAAIAPQAALQSNFGEALEGSVSEIVVRNWGALIGLVGAMLIYAAYHPATRPLVLTVAGISKLTFIILVLVHGQQYLDEQAGVAIAVDAVWVLLFVGYFIGVRNAARIDTSVRSV